MYEFEQHHVKRELRGVREQRSPDTVEYIGL